MASDAPRPLDVTRWELWKLPGRLIGSVLLIQLLAVALIALDVTSAAPRAFISTATTSIAITAGAILHNEISLRIERVRQRIVRDAAHIDLSSVWTFAAAISLPPVVASAVVVAIYTYRYFRVWRPAKVPPHRVAFNAATVLLAVHAAAGITTYASHGATDVFRTPLGPLTVVLALIAYTVVNTCLVVGVVVVNASKTVRDVLGRGDEIVLEVATLSLGGLVALVLSTDGPWLALFVLPPLLVLHRAVLVRQLELAADTDGKTGLLTAAAWHRQSTQQLLRAHQTDGSAAVLILDLDHFKRVNDHHGHLAGDLVLQAVAATLRGEVRDNDLVGRFGGEEFVLLLPRPENAGYGYGELRRIAERIRRSVEQLDVEVPTPDGPLTISDVSVSIGGAVFPEDGTQVQDLVAVADSALYAAKRAGRNVVRLGRHRMPSPAEHADRSEPPRPD